MHGELMRISILMMTLIIMLGLTVIVQTWNAWYFVTGIGVIAFLLLIVVVRMITKQTNK